MATTTTLTRPSEVGPGMVIRINVPNGTPYRNDVDCTVLEVKKVRTGGATKYGITIQEPKVPGRNGKSTRWFSPRSYVHVVGVEVEGSD